MVFGNGVKNMQAVANNGAPTCKVAKNCGSRPKSEKSKIII